MKKKINVSCSVFTGTSNDHMALKDFEVEVEGEATVLNVLEVLYEKCDADFAFYSFCRQGLCGGCLVEVNGKRVMACKTPAEDNMTILPVLE